jgi:nitroimidazol reductase NimA-like FMN-containing flavoprotein (pyridoxamine 5'-phosphate oxidase superfamily)
VEIDRNGLEILARDECLKLLGTSALGRIGCTSGALPLVLPVNFRLVGDAVVFRTGVGTKLAAATRNAVVAFEVDEMDPLDHTGWSVLVTGFAREVTNQHELDKMSVDHIPRWAPGGDGRVVSISTELISGRRIVSAARPER